MQVRDFARLDFKCDSDGNPFFLEINPLPTFAVDNTFAILAEIRGEPYEEFLAGVLKQAINRVTA
jgi:D-alanine-D-alanine ligase